MIHPFLLALAIHFFLPLHFLVYHSAFPSLRTLGHKLGAGSNRMFCTLLALHLALLHFFLCFLHFARFSSQAQPCQRHPLCQTFPLSVNSSLSLSLSLSPLHPGKWFYPVEWLCKDTGTGFKPSPLKRKDTKRKIKQREAGEKIH